MFVINRLSDFENFMCVQVSAFFIIDVEFKSFYFFVRGFKRFIEQLASKPVVADAVVPEIA